MGGMDDLVVLASGVNEGNGFATEADALADAERQLEKLTASVRAAMPNAVIHVGPISPA